MVATVVLIILIAAALIASFRYMSKNGACGTCELAGSCTHNRCRVKKPDRKQKKMIDELMKKHHLKTVGD